MIAVGTENAAKLAAVRRTLREYPALQDLSVAGVKVPAGGTNRADCRLLLPGQSVSLTVQIDFLEI